MTPKTHRLQLLVRLALLAAIGVASSACCFDGHFGRYGHSHGRHFCAPVRHCR